MQSIKGSVIIGLGIVLGSIILKLAPTGRYQFGGGPTYVYVIDTVTGRVWSQDGHRRIVRSDESEGDFFGPKK